MIRTLLAWLFAPTWEGFATPRKGCTGICTPLQGIAMLLIVLFFGWIGNSFADSGSLDFSSYFN